MESERLAKAQANLLIQGVCLREGKIVVKSDVFPDSLDQNETISQGFRAFVKVRAWTFEDAEDEEKWGYRYLYTAGVRLIPSSEEAESGAEDYEPLIEIVGVFEASYTSPIELDEASLMAYSVDNVCYHVWPYWREYVQSSCARMGLSPALAVPVYRMTPKD